MEIINGVLTQPTIADYVSQLGEKLKEKFPTISLDPSTPQGQLIQALAEQVYYNDDQNLLQLWNFLDPSQMSQKNLNQFAMLYGLKQKTSSGYTSCIVRVVISGGTTYTVPEGTTFKNNSSGKIYTFDVYDYITSIETTNYVFYASCTSLEKVKDTFYIGQTFMLETGGSGITEIVAVSNYSYPEDENLEDFRTRVLNSINNNALTVSGLENYLINNTNSNFVKVFDNSKIASFFPGSSLLASFPLGTILVVSDPSLINPNNMFIPLFYNKLPLGVATLATVEKLTYEDDPVVYTQSVWFDGNTYTFSIFSLLTQNVGFSFEYTNEKQIPLNELILIDDLQKELQDFFDLKYNQRVYKTDFLEIVCNFFQERNIKYYSYAFTVAPQSFLQATGPYLTLPLLYTRNLVSQVQVSEYTL